MLFDLYTHVLQLSDSSQRKDSMDTFLCSCIVYCVLSMKYMYQTIDLPSAASAEAAFTFQHTFASSASANNTT